MGDEEFVSILVPKDRVMDVYQFLTERPTASRVVGEVRDREPSLDAVASDPILIGRAYRESPRAMKQFFELLADRPDEWVGIDEVRDAMGLRMHQFPGVLGAFQRRWTGRYEQGRTWPWRSEWSNETGRWTWRYLMPKENSDTVRSLVQSGPDGREPVSQRTGS